MSIECQGTSQRACHDTENDGSTNFDDPSFSGFISNLSCAYNVRPLLSECVARCLCLCDMSDVLTPNSKYICCDNLCVLEYGVDVYVFFVSVQDVVDASWPCTMRRGTQFVWRGVDCFYDYKLLLHFDWCFDHRLHLDLDWTLCVLLEGSKLEWLCVHCVSDCMFCDLNG